MVSAPARRLTLDPAEWAVLAGDLLPDAPPGFEPTRVEPPARAGAARRLAHGGVLVAEGQVPVAAVTAQLGVLRRPVATVRLDVDGPGGGRRAWLAVGRGVVVGVVTLAGGAVELSVAPAVRLGEELARAVPEVATVTGRVARPGEPPPAGRVPLALLADEPATGAEGDDLAFLRDLQRRTAGSLTGLVLGRAGEHLGAGAVSWLATDAGWVGLRPRPDGSPRRLVDVVPVRPADLGTWLAPALAALLEGSDEQS